MRSQTKGNNNKEFQLMILKSSESFVSTTYRKRKPNWYFVQKLLLNNKSRRIVRKHCEWLEVDPDEFYF